MYERKKKISLNRKDIVIAYTILRITVGLALMMVQAFNLENLKGDSEAIALVLTGNLPVITSIFISFLGLQLILGSDNRSTIIILLSINTLFVASKFHDFKEAIEKAAEAPDIVMGTIGLGVNASLIIQTCLYHFLLLFLLVCNSFNDLSFNIWSYPNPKNKDKKANKQSNEGNK